MISGILNRRPFPLDSSGGAFFGKPNCSRRSSSVVRYAEICEVASDLSTTSSARNSGNLDARIHSSLERRRLFQATLIIPQSLGFHARHQFQPSLFLTF